MTTTTARRTLLDIPPPYRQLFEDYEQLNAVQAAVLDVLLHSARSVVLSAPTGSGKTVAFELAIVKMLRDHALYADVDADADADANADANADVEADAAAALPAKAVYVAPIKALCAEKFRDWQRRFAALALAVPCLQITGDSTDAVDMTALCAAQIIVTTPEKWDSLTRRWREYNEVLQAVRLFMIDEVHLLNEDVRGPILEAVVARMKAMDRTASLRFVVASATIPNIEDLSQWLARRHAHAADSPSTDRSTVAQFKFSDMERPIPLEKHIVGLNSTLKGFRFDISLNYKLADILRRYSERRPTLIFCSSRKSTEMAANVLEKQVATLFAMGDQSRATLADVAARLHDTKLAKLVANGLAYHHAGMSYDDRSTIEDSFRQGALMVLISTNTLAMGVNLPAHLVVIKSTEYYCRGSFVEYSESTLLQMIGRAGRPQYDVKGVAVILTYSRNVRKYENLMTGQQPVESHLHTHLAEHLNSEIALNTITNLELAMHWMRSTYLYVRAMRNPGLYGIVGMAGRLDRHSIEQQLEAFCLLQINALRDAGLIKRQTSADCLELQITPYGKLMSKYYLSFETMKLFRQIRGDESLLETLCLVVRCKEFAEFMLRVNEKKLLNELNSTPIRYPISGRIKTHEDKILCLIQAVFGNLHVPTPGLAMESTKMLRIGDRVAKCLLEYLRLGENQLATDCRVGCYNVVLHAVTIAKCFHAKLWENSEYASKQLRKIGCVYSGLLANAGKTTLKSIGETDARTIELILNRAYPFGDEVLQNLLSFPEYSLQLTRPAPDMLQICVRQFNDDYATTVGGAGSNAVLVVGDSSNTLLLFDENLDNTLCLYGYFERTLQIPNPAVECITAHVVHKTLVGVDVKSALVWNSPKGQQDPKEPATPTTKKGSTAVAPRKRRQQQTKPPEPPVKRVKTNSLATSVGPSAALQEPPPIGLDSFSYSINKLQPQKATEVDAPEPQAQLTNRKRLQQQTRVTEYFTKSKKLSSRRCSPSPNKTTPSESAATENGLHDETLLNLAISPAVVVIESPSDSPLPLPVDDRSSSPTADEVAVLEVLGPMDLSRRNAVERQHRPPSICRSISPISNAVAAANSSPMTSMTTHTAPPAVSQTCPKEKSLRAVYEVTLAFMNLAREEQDFANFRRIYNQLTTLPRRRESPTIQTRPTELPVVPSGAPVNTNASCSMAVSTTTDRSTSLPGPASSRFRLQIFKDKPQSTPLLSPPPVVLPATVKPQSASLQRTNQNVMQDILHTKYDDNKENEVEKCLNERPEIARMGEMGAVHLRRTFEDYCRLYLDMDGAEENENTLDP